MVVLLLVPEALLFAPQRWRVRLLLTLQFSVPACSLLVLSALMPGTCCSCDERPWGVALRSLEFFSDFFYCNAVATLPALALFAVFGRPVPASVQGRVHVRALHSTLLVSVLVTTGVYGSFFLFKQQLVFSR